MKEVFIPRSSNLAEIQYDSDANTLTISFKDGRAWEYANVPQSVYMGLQNAQSAGSYFWKNVRGVYNETEV